MSDLSETDKIYNKEITLLDGLLEFHPDLLIDISKQDMTLLERYYLVGQSVPLDVFVYRAQVIHDDPALAKRAQKVLYGVLDKLGMEEVN